MSYKFSKESIHQLSTCDNRLQEILFEAIKIVDFRVIQGHRTLEEHLKNLELGKSKAKVSKHCSFPSKAVDIHPCPHPKGSDVTQFFYLAGVIKAIAFQKGIKIIWGGNWVKFIDCYHFELVE